MKNDLTNFLEYAEEKNEIFPANFSKYEIQKNDNFSKNENNFFVESKIYESKEIYPFPFYKPISSLVIPFTDEK